MNSKLLLVIFLSVTALIQAAPLAKPDNELGTGDGEDEDEKELAQLEADEKKEDEEYEEEQRKLTEQLEEEVKKLIGPLEDEEKLHEEQDRDDEKQLVDEGRKSEADLNEEIGKIEKTLAEAIEGNDQIKVESKDEKKPETKAPAGNNEEISLNEFVDEDNPVEVLLFYNENEDPVLNAVNTIDETIDQQLDKLVNLAAKGQLPDLEK